MRDAAAKIALIAAGDSQRGFGDHPLAVARGYEKIFSKVRTCEFCGNVRPTYRNPNPKASKKLSLLDGNATRVILSIVLS